MPQKGSCSILLLSREQQFYKAFFILRPQGIFSEKRWTRGANLPYNEGVGVCGGVIQRIRKAQASCRQEAFKCHKSQSSAKYQDQRLTFVTAKCYDHKYHWPRGQQQRNKAAGHVKPMSSQLKNPKWRDWSEKLLEKTCPAPCTELSSPGLGAKLSEAEVGFGYADGFGR